VRKGAASTTSRLSMEKREEGGKSEMVVGKRNKKATTGRTDVLLSL